MCIYIYIRIYIYIYIHSVSPSLSLYIYIYIYICMVCMHVNTCMYIQISARTHYPYASCAKESMWMHLLVTDRHASTR